VLRLDFADLRYLFAPHTFLVACQSTLLFTTFTTGLQSSYNCNLEHVRARSFPCRRQLHNWIIRLMLRSIQATRKLWSEVKILAISPYGLFVLLKISRNNPMSSRNNADAPFLIPSLSLSVQPKLCARHKINLPIVSTSPAYLGDTSPKSKKHELTVSDQIVSEYHIVDCDITFTDIAVSDAHVVEFSE
jgi:hypothetical protein